MPADLDELYDDVTVGALDRWQAPRRQVPAAVATGWRRHVGVTALAAAATIGVGDAVDGERRQGVVEEVDLDAIGAHSAQAVTYLHRPGRPRASVAIVRPWLL
jgi:hypothetical protein